MRLAEPRTYFMAMAVYWLIFGLITTFYAPLMDLFQTADGVAAKTAFSTHVWMHGGLDILSFCVLLFALSTLPPSRTMLRAAALAALGPTIAIVWSLCWRRVGGTHCSPSPALAASASPCGASCSPTGSANPRRHLRRHLRTSAQGG